MYNGVAFWSEGIYIIHLYQSTISHSTITPQRVVKAARDFLLLSVMFYISNRTSGIVVIDNMVTTYL